MINSVRGHGYGREWVSIDDCMQMNGQDIGAYTIHIGNAVLCPIHTFTQLGVPHGTKHSCALASTRSLMLPEQAQK